MDHETTTNILLGVIAGLLGIIAFFLMRLLSHFDSMSVYMRKLGGAFLLFRQRVSLLLNIPVDDDDILETPPSP